MHGNSWRTNRGHLRGSSMSHSPSPGLAPLPTPRLSRPRSSSEAISPRAGTPVAGGKADAAAAVPTITVDHAKHAPGPLVAELTPAPAPAPAPTVGSSSVVHVAIALAVAVLLPILAFPVVPGFVGRLIVVCLVGMSVVGSVVQSGSVECGAGGFSRDLFLSVAIYTGVMAVAAGVLQS